MSSLLSAPRESLDDTQLPRIWNLPPHVSSSGAEAVDLCRMAGLELDPWQEFVLGNALNERADGKWAAFEVGLVVSRQNGKGSILEARELAGLFLLGERLVIHSAHQFDTSLEAFRRLLFLIEDTPDFDRRVKRVSRSHGEEGIELLGGQRIRFRTRTKGGGRGFTGDCVILDEAMFLPEATVGALMPVMSARPNPQLWYTGSAVDQLLHDDGVTLARLRERGMRRGDPSLAYFEWSVDAATPDDLGDEMAKNEVLWVQANPALGIRISAEHVGNEQRSMDARTFAVERLGVGDWPRTDGAESIIGMGVWDELADARSEPLDPVWFSLDVTPGRDRATISAAGLREDGRYHVEVIDRRNGTDWLPARCAELAKHEPHGFLADDRGPVASLLPEIKLAGVDVETLNAQDHAQACGFLIDAVNQGKLVHLAQPELRAAIKGAATRPLGDAWAWSRKNSHVDISPLVSCTLALWGFGRSSGDGDEPWCAAW
jgi:hypothetical protein